MARFTSYSNKAKPADSDTLLINDASSSSNKQILLSGLFAWLKDKFTNTPISGLETTNQTIVGAINELKEDLDNIEGGGGSGDGLTSEVKDALLAIFQHVAYADSGGQAYYDALEEALYPTATTRTVSYSLSHVTSSNNASTVTSGASYTATLTASSGYTINTVTVTMGGADVTSTVYSSGTITIPSVTGNIVITATAVTSVSSITAVYTQSGTVYDTDTLNSLKSDLVVTATYTGGTTSTIPGTDYTLSGTLTAGTSTITVSYSGKTTTFTVTVTEYSDVPSEYTWLYQSSSGTVLSADTTNVYGVLSQGTITEEISSGFLHINLGSASNNYYQYELLPRTTTNAVLTVKARCNTLSNFSSAFTGMRLLLSNGTSGANMSIDRSKIRYGEGSTVQNVSFPTGFDYTDWHIYKLELTSTGHQIGYIDGVQVFDSATLSTSYSVENRLALIQSSGSYPTDVDIEWVAYLDRSAS